MCCRYKNTYYGNLYYDVLETLELPLVVLAASTLWFASESSDLLKPALHPKNVSDKIIFANFLINSLLPKHISLKNLQHLLSPPPGFVKCFVNFFRYIFLLLVASEISNFFIENFGKKISEQWKGLGNEKLKSKVFSFCKFNYTGRIGCNNIDPLKKEEAEIDFTNRSFQQEHGTQVMHEMLSESNK